MSFATAIAPRRVLVWWRPSNSSAPAQMCVTAREYPEGGWCVEPVVSAVTP
jgi:hypothetical protein